MMGAVGWTAAQTSRKTRSWETMGRPLTLLAVIVVSAMTQRILVLGCPQECTCQPATATVFCRNARLTEVPDGIPRNTKVLHLDNNRISKLPEYGILYSLGDLQELYLDNNDIDTIERRSLPKSLRHLYMSGNVVTAIMPPMFRKLNHLQRLHLNSNNISRIAKTALPKHLKYLQLDFNKLTLIEVGQLSYLRKLTELFLNSNRISRIEQGALPPKLRIIRLGHNRLEEIGLQFSSMKNLRVLYLYSNKIRIIYNRAFSHLPLLQDLSLLDNQLTTIQPRLFENLTSLADLNLFKNKIHTIAKSSLPPSGKLQRLYLQENPMRCDCRTEWLARRLQTDRLNTAMFDFYFYDVSIPDEERPFEYPDENDILCESPSELRGKRIRDVNFAGFCREPLTTALPSVPAFFTDIIITAASTPDRVATWLQFKLSGNTGPPPVSPPSDDDLKRWLNGRSATEKGDYQNFPLIIDGPSSVKSLASSARHSAWLLLGAILLSISVTLQTLWL